MHVPTMQVVASRERDPRIQEAVTAAMKAIVAHAGNQTLAAEMIDLSQSRVSAVVNGKALVEVDTLVRMRRVLGWSWEQLLGQPPQPAPAPELDAGTVVGALRNVTRAAAGEQPSRLAKATRR